MDSRFIDPEMAKDSEVSILQFINGNFQYAESLADTPNSSTTTYITKVTLTTNNLALGSYVLTAQYKATSSNANRGASVRVLQGTTVLKITEEFFASTQEKPIRPIVAYLPNISGVRTFTLDFKVGVTGLLTGTMIILSDCSLYLQRVR